MYLQIEIKTHLKFLFKEGFKVAEYVNHGMAEFCKLEYPILTMEIWRDRIDYSANIIYNEKYYEPSRLANFLNGKTEKYKWNDFSDETQNVDSERFLTLLNGLMESEFDNILDFLFNLTDSKQKEFTEYNEKIAIEKNKY